MNKPEFISEIRNLKNLHPKADFAARTRENLMVFCRANQPVAKIKIGHVFTPIFMRTGALALGSVALLLLGWELILSPLILSKNPVSLNISSIKSEWQLADISPYLNNIFNSDLMAKNVDSALNQLARQDVSMATAQVNIKSEAQSISIDKALPALNNLKNGEVDQMLNELTF